MANHLRIKLSTWPGLNPPQSCLKRQLMLIRVFQHKMCLMKPMSVFTNKYKALCLLFVFCVVCLCCLFVLFVCCLCCLFMMFVMFVLFVLFVLLFVCLFVCLSIPLIWDWLALNWWQCTGYCWQIWLRNRRFGRRTKNERGTKLEVRLLNDVADVISSNRFIPTTSSTQMISGAQNKFYNTFLQKKICFLILFGSLFFFFFGIV